MRRRNRNKKQVKIVIGAVVCFLLIMTTGYAAFSTNLTLNATGNIHNLMTVEKLKQKVVTTGDGLYEDAYESGRYIYRGINPSNYLMFSSNLYRIVSIEKDGTVKVIKNDSITAIPFDSKDYRYEADSYCSGIFQGNYCGCNLWGNNISMFDSIGNSIKTFPTYYGATANMLIATKEAAINTYLNTTFYSSLAEKDRAYIVNHKFSVGKVSRDINVSAFENLKTAIMDEKSNLWIGKIGLVGVTDYIRASTSEDCDIWRNYEGRCSGDKCSCYTNNYMAPATNLRTLTPLSWGNLGTDTTDRCVTGVVAPSVKGAVVTITANSSSYISYYPSFYISVSKFLGSGTENDPYKIKQ